MYGSSSSNRMEWDIVENNPANSYVTVSCGGHIQKVDRNDIPYEKALNNGYGDFNDEYNRTH